MSLLKSSMNVARASHAKGDFNAAIRAYDSILRIEPHNFEAAYFKAVALYQSGRLEDAAKSFGAAGKINSRRFEPHKDRGLIFLKLGRHGEAADAFRLAIERQPKAPDLHLNLGMALKNAGHAEAAIESYQAALALKAVFPEAFNNLANAQLHLGRKEEALESYRKAIALNPKYIEAYVNAAETLVALKRQDEAESLLQDALTFNKDSASIYRGLAKCADARGDRPEALSLVNRAIALDKRSADSYVTRAELHEADGKTDDAIADYRQAIALEPTSLSALLGLANLFNNQSRYDEAISLCDRAIAAQPNRSDPYYSIGVIFESQREYPAAISSYDKALEIDPKFFDARSRRARALNDAGKHALALEEFDTLILSDPSSAILHRARADVLRQLRRHEEALLAINSAIALDPEEPHSYGARGSIKTELGLHEEALADFETSLSLIAKGTTATLVAEDCIRLLSVDKIPAIYENESELSATREKVEETLDALLERYGEGTKLSSEQIRIAELGLRHLTGFYLTYHQRNDRETMRKISTISSRLLGLQSGDARTRSAHGAKIRIGIASQRLRDHNGANWSYNWYAQLPRDDYEFFTYAFEYSSDPVAQKFAALGTHRQMRWSRDNPHEIVQSMRNDKLDYLMLTDVGMTPVSRFLSINRIAPRQFTAWGHPVTTGSAEMDFYLSSDLMEPVDAQDHYTEKLIRLPNLALYLDEQVRQATADPTTEFGLPEGRVLYGCLQSLFKYLPRYDSIFPRIAREVPNALFVFLQGSPSYTTHIMNRRLAGAFRSEGLEAEKHVIFLPRQKPTAFDRLMAAMDVCVDSIGWTGGNTSIRAVELGTPLATLDGKFMRGRHTSAIFRMMGVDEFVASDLDQYVSFLVRLGREEAFRRHCRDAFEKNHWKLYGDQKFIGGLDAFLKAEHHSKGASGSN